MKESKKQIQTRLDKIEFLNGLKNKSRTLDEIIKLQDIYLEYVTVDGAVVIKNKDGNLITREEKLAFLNGVKNKTRSITEITDPPVIFLIYRDDQPDKVLNELTGEILTVEQAEAIRSKKYENTIVWVEWRKQIKNDS